MHKLCTLGLAYLPLINGADLLIWVGMSALHELSPSKDVSNALVFKNHTPENKT